MNKSLNKVFNKSHESDWFFLNIISVQLHAFLSSSDLFASFISGSAMEEDMYIINPMYMENNMKFNNLIRSFMDDVCECDHDVLSSVVLSFVYFVYLSLKDSKGLFVFVSGIDSSIDVMDTDDADVS